MGDVAGDGGAGRRRRGRTGGKETNVQGHGKAAALYSKNIREPVKGNACPRSWECPGSRWKAGAQDTTVDVDTG